MNRYQLNKKKFKYDRAACLNIVIICLVGFFVLGEMAGYYSVKNISENDIGDSIVDYKLYEYVQNIYRIPFSYLPGIFSLFFPKLTIILPMVLIVRGYLFSCALSASILYDFSAFQIGPVILFPAFVHSASLIYFFGNVICNTFMKQNILIGTLENEKKAFEKCLVLAVFAILIYILINLLY